MSGKKTLSQVLADKRKVVFLKVLAKTGKVIEAARAIGMNSTTSLYIARQDDEEFAKAWDAAVYASADLLEEAMWDRAVDGVDEPILFKGEVVATQKRYSDSLLLALAASRRKEFQKKTNIDANVDVNVKVGIAVIPLTAVDAKDWERQVAIIHAEQKALPSFDEPGVVDGEFEEVAEGGAKPKAAPEPMQQRTLGRG